MKEQLNSIILSEIELIMKLLLLLEEQHSFIIKDDIFGMEGIVGRIEECSREIAKVEVERRKITDGRSMRDIITELEDKEMDANFRKMRKLLEETRIQKDTNELLIRQGLGFTSRMLGILSPDRSRKTYNSYGKVGNR